MRWKPFFKKLDNYLNRGGTEMEDMFSKRDKAVVEIVVKYDDGSEKVIKNGAAVTLEPNGEDETTIKMEMTDFQKNELITMIYGFTEMGVRMGLFDGEGE